MKFMRRDVCILLLPCIGLALWAAATSRAKTTPTLTISCVAETPKPDPSWVGSDTRLITTIETTDTSFATRWQTFKWNFTSGGYTYRWYYNTRIEGIYQGRKQIFYSSNDFMTPGCWIAASSNFKGWNGHEYRERFALHSLPPTATKLQYVVEAVAFKSPYFAGESVGQKQIQQMRGWKNFAGYGIHSIPLRRATSLKSSNLQKHRELP